MGRNLRSSLPQVGELLEPALPSIKILRGRESTYKSKMKRNYDKRHRTAPLKKLHPNQRVYVKKENKHYEVVDQHSTPRSYILKGPDGDLKRRNRRQMVPVSSELDVQAGPSTMCSEGVKPGSHSVTLQQSWSGSLPRRSTRNTKGRLPLRYRQ